MINSNIKALTSHTKTNLIPNKLKILPIVGTSLIDCFWEGIPVPVLIQPYHNETPVYYSSVSAPVLTVTGLQPNEYDFKIIKQVTISNWDKSQNPCDVNPTGCYLAEITTLLKNDTNGVTKSDKCGNEITIPTPKKVIADFLFCTQIDNNTICGGLSGICVHSLDDPFTVRLQNEDVSYLHYAKMFDVDDVTGNGVVFGDNDSSVSQLLSTIFDDGFTNNINGKIKNFGDNIHNLDKSDTTSLDDLGESIGTPSLNFSEGIPTEIQEILKLGSMSYEDIFGFDDYSILFDEDNVGDLLNPSEMVKSGQVLFTKPVLNPDNEYELFTVSKPNNLTSFTPSVLLGVDEFPLSSIDNGVYNTNDYCFWENNTPLSGKRVGGIVDNSYITHLPTKDQWHDIIQSKIEYQLNKNLFG